MRSVAWPVTWYHWCPCRRKSEHRPLQREDHMKTPPYRQKRASHKEHPEHSLPLWASEWAKAADTMILNNEK